MSRFHHHSDKTHRIECDILYLVLWWVGGHPAVACLGERTRPLRTARCSLLFPFFIDKGVRDPNSSKIRCLLILTDLKVGREILNLGGSFLNSLILDWYLETKLKLQVSSKLLRSWMTCFISVMELFIASSCLFRAAWCFESMTSISVCLLWMIMSISSWRASPCFSSSAISF